MGDTVVYTREMVWHWLRNRQSYLWLGSSIRPDDKLGVRAPKAEEAVHCRRSELNADMATALLYLDPRDRDLLLLCVSVKYSTLQTGRGDDWDDRISNLFAYDKTSDMRKVRDQAVDRMVTVLNRDSQTNLDESVSAVVNLR